MKYIIRLLLVIIGLIFAVSLAAIMMILLLAWAVRAICCKFTGRKVSPFVMRMNPRSGFDQVFRQGSRDSTQSLRRVPDDVTDVEPKK